MLWVVYCDEDEVCNVLLARTRRRPSHGHFDARVSDSTVRKEQEGHSQWSFGYRLWVRLTHSQWLRGYCYLTASTCFLSMVTAALVSAILSFYMRFYGRHTAMKLEIRRRHSMYKWWHGEDTQLDVPSMLYMVPCCTWERYCCVAEKNHLDSITWDMFSVRIPL